MEKRKRRRSKSSTNTSETLEMSNRDGINNIKHTSQDNHSMNNSFKNKVGNIIEDGIDNVKLIINLT